MEYEVYFEGKVFVEADSEDIATDEAYTQLKRAGVDFQITSVEEC